MHIYRNKEGFPYLYKNKLHHYYPDFIIGGVYYEIKNFKTDLVVEKQQQFPSDRQLKILYGADMGVYLNYCIETYGTNFTSLAQD